MRSESTDVSESPVGNYECVSIGVGAAPFGKHVTIAHQARIVIWCGPVGVFEFEAFHSGTQAIAITVAACEGFTLARGGDTIAAIERFKVVGRIDCILTAGGAFLAYVEGEEPPAFASLIGL